MNTENTIDMSGLVAIEDADLEIVAGGCGGSKGRRPTSGRTAAFNVNTVNFEDNVIIAEDDVNITIVQGG